MTKNTTNNKGISLLIVVLIGAVMLLTSVSIGLYAKRMVSSLQARSDAVQTLYTAEQSFECVKYWLNKDYRSFSSNIIATSPQPVCNGYSFNFISYNDTAGDGHTPSYNSGTGIGTFRIPFDPSDPAKGGVVVEVDRINHSAELFDGNVRVYSQSNTPTGSKTSERFQDYKYRLLYGADIMFVVDRSGSIDDGGDGDDDPENNRMLNKRHYNNEWNDMLDALNDTIRLLNQRIPAPYIGITSFGTDPTDTGSAAPECGFYCGLVDWRAPDTPLTNTLSDLINDRGTTDTADDVPEMNLDLASTNLSLGMAVGGSELMGKYYPFSGFGDPSALGVPQGQGSGGFEKWVHGAVNFSDLPDTSSSIERTPDSEYPDVMIIITDGAPNGIMTHVVGNWEWSTVDNIPEFLLPLPHTYELGEAKLFRTPSIGTGQLIIDETSDKSSYAPTPATIEYQKCYDGSSFKPSNLFSGSDSYTNFDGTISTGNIYTLNDNTYPHYAMCNSTLVANKLKGEGIIIIAILVADKTLPTNAEKEAAVWLANYVVSNTDVADGEEPLLAVIDEYEDIREATLYLFEKLDLVQSR